jgi:uncharacterized protein (TIGR04222 family)
MLSPSQAALYQRLQNFELDDPTHELGFTRHLMRNQGWTLTYVYKAIAEYKKFAFLTVVANHQMVPSDQVDQVWHAHILLTQSYWEDFCPKVLGKQLHHHPARGGRTERAEFHRLYAQTIASYRQFFGEPPTDVWSPPDQRFGTELKMQRVNLSDHWVIPKRLPQPHFLKVWLIVPSVALSVTACTTTYQISPVGNFVSSMLTNWVVMTVGIAILLGLGLRHVIRQPENQPRKPQLDAYQIAYLIGGKSRAVELAIAQLVHQGNLRPNVSNRTLTIAKQSPPESTDLEQQVMNLAHQTSQFKSLRQWNRYQTSFLRQSLEQQRLLMPLRSTVLGYSFIAFVVATFFGLMTGLIGTLPTIGLLFWILIGIVTGCCYVPSGRTRWGSEMVTDFQRNHDPYDRWHRFALHGYQTLSGGALDDLRQIFAAQEKEDSATAGCGC